MTNAYGSHTKTGTNYIAAGSIIFPVANFMGTPVTGAYPITVIFTDKDGSIVNATLQNPVHTYTTAGMFTVSLNVTNAVGSNTSTKEHYITASVIPVSGFTGTPVFGTAPLTVTFRDLTTNLPTAWNWTFGDGSLVNATHQNPVHTYDSPGTYTVSLEVSNVAGSNMSIKSKFVKVIVIPTVIGITPATGSNSTIITISNLSGTNFTSGSTVKLTPININPEHKGSISNGSGGALLSNPNGIFVSGNYAYITSWANNALEIVDITNPAAPVHKGSIANGAGGALLLRPHGVFVSGNYAYVTSTGSNALEIVDVTNPAAPVHKGSILDGTGGARLYYPYAVYVSGNYAYVASMLSNAIEIINVTNPAAPVHKGSLSEGSGGALLYYPYAIQVSGGYAYVASRNSNALEIVNVTNPAAPLHKGSIVNGAGGALLAYPRDVYVSGNFAYVASTGSNALEIVDITNPTAPVHKGSIANGAGGTLLSAPTGIYVSGNNAYIASTESNALEIVDVSNPATPIHKGSISNGAGGSFLSVPTGIYVSGKYAYVASEGSNALEILDTEPDTGSVFATEVNVVSSKQITCVFNLTGTTPGPYNVVVTNTDGQFGTLTKGFTVTVPSLLANFTANVTSGLLPRTIRFTDTSTGLPTTWNWSFGDGSLAAIQNPIHTYMKAGNHTVTLTASNAGGANTTVKEKYITIYPKGDFNHNWEVDVGDVALVAYMVVNRVPAQVPDADFNANGFVDIGDAGKIAYFVVGKVPAL
ncbi:MAG: hypothetical protein STSR0009_00360 [Methanoregula sp.]